MRVLLLALWPSVLASASLVPELSQLSSSPTVYLLRSYMYNAPSFNKGLIEVYHVLNRLAFLTFCGFVGFGVLVAVQSVAPIA